MAENYDVVVIGAGPAGYVAAIRAAQLGQKCAIVDKEWLGGVCLNIGCIPSKALLKNAEVAYTLQNRGKELGFSFKDLELDYSAAVKRSRQVSERLVKGVDFLMRKNGITVYRGEAIIDQPGFVSVADKDGAKTQLAAKNIIVATGASPAVPAAWKVDGKKVVTYREAILQEVLPKSVVIIGAGAIGMEFATVWKAYGIEVTIVEMLPQILPLEDPDAAAEVAKAYTRRGVKVLAGHKVEAVETTGTGVRVTVSSGGEPEVLDAEQALVAVGFRPNSSGLGLEQIGVRFSERGFIEINEKMQTNVSGVWAVGDVTGKLMLAHAGSVMGIVCAEHIARHETVNLNYEMMPRATFCSPQVASFGLNEVQAKERGYAAIVGRFPFQANGKALGLGEYDGWIKLVVDEKFGEILGATLVGPEVTELLPELTLAQMMELTPAEIARNIHAHPTLSEVLMEAAHSALGNAIHI